MAEPGSEFKYDVCLSFAGEDRQYVEAVAEELKRRGVRVFYDKYERVALWGKDLYQHLDHIYGTAARYCVVFISKYYAGKVWATHEMASAQARALNEAVEYVLPARFDSTEVPGLRSTVGYLDLSKMESRELAQLICQKLDRLESGDDSGGRWQCEWFDPVRFNTLKGEGELTLFQGLPIGGNLASVGSVIAKALDALEGQVQIEGIEQFWTHGEDRRFDRLYATASVVTALLQVGLSDRNRMLQSGIKFLQTAECSSVDDRAAVAFLLIAGLLSERDAAAFVETLARKQVKEVGSDLRGSFLLSQGPSGSRGGARAIWSDSSVHSDGASFHACHLADVLLHIPPQYLSARREAHQVLAGCRDFLIREFQRHEGWLVDIHGERTPLTVFGLALCRPLSISLPSQWLDIALTALGMLDSDRYGFLTRCFGVVNASYLTRTAVDADFSAKAEAYARKSLASFLGIEHFSTRPPRDIAALLRAVVHALELIDCRLLSLVLKVGVEHDQ